MEHHTLLVLLAITIVLAADKQFDHLKDIIRRETGILIEYNLPKAQAFQTFNDFIASIQEMKVLAQDYKGSHRQNISNSVDLAHQAAKNYSAVAVKLNGWCAFTHNLVEHIFENKPNENLTYIAITTALEEGFKVVKATVGTLENIQHELLDKFKPTLKSMTLGDLANNRTNPFHISYSTLIKSIENVRNNFKQLDPKVEKELVRTQVLSGEIQAYFQLAKDLNETEEHELKELRKSVQEYMFPELSRWAEETEDPIQN
uniref:Uncharacterized protein n=1 Tax=Cacopsylla melanoneura TaxID=428564 RepID=A0A8D8LGR3_9HEMI